jgi:histidine triad (HIT) family protein
MPDPSQPPTAPTPSSGVKGDCLFCKIRDGQIPATVVYRDDRALAFKDIGPKAPLHVLVIPLAHVETLGEAEPAHESLLGHLMLVAAQVAHDAGHTDKGFRVVMNSGVGAGQTVFHMHLHVLAGRSFGWPPG